MAFPFLLESNFELGTNAEWTSESDTGSRLDFPHYSELARWPIGPAAPFRGAFCARVSMGDTNDHTLTSTTITQALANTAFYRFMLYVGTDVAASADDTFAIFELQSVGPVIEASVGLRITASTGAVEIGIGELAPTAFAAGLLTKGVWHAIELRAVIDAGAGNDGTLTLWVDGSQVASVTALDQAAVTQGVLGTQDTLATTTGTLLFDQVVMDDLRIFPIVDRYPEVVALTKSSHVFVGAGVIDNVTLVSGAAADNVATVYDTSRGNTNDALKVATRLNNVTASATDDPAGMPVRLIRGAYVQLTGTNPRAYVKLREVSANSPASIRSLGLRAKVNQLEAL